MPATAELNTNLPAIAPEIAQILQRHWGFRHLRPLQREAIDCVLTGRDSLTILPTGGGKSLCFQVPALAMNGLAVVVSPLISLMKDQVDALRQCGVMAGRIDSSLTPEERGEMFTRIRAGELRLLYISPERLVSDWMRDYLARVNLSFIAIDEAHCISMWGHDFRPEYAQLGGLRAQFPDVALHAFTATATPQVQVDIIARLKLSEPERLVGSFYRPNLHYRVERRRERLAQIEAAIKRHRGEAGIIYSISRLNVEALAEDLRARGYRAAPYHAGLDDATRHRNQDDFINERIDIIVATVAFGMGIDKSNVRFVIHAALPKSIEHYQQESGRAGRDGLPAECLLLYSQRDRETWRMLLENSEQPARGIAMKKLDDMLAYAAGVECRHRSLLGYFGEQFRREHCAACDVCEGDLEPVADPRVTAQQALSCVVRMGEAWDATAVASVLAGTPEARLKAHRFEQLSTHGLLKTQHKTRIVDWIDQLLAQGCLAAQNGALAVTPRGWEVLRGQHTPRLMSPVPAGRCSAAGEAKKGEKTRGRRARGELDSVSEELFEVLRAVRKALALAAKVPPYLVLSDASLRGLAQTRPSTPEGLIRVSGIGEVKRERYGEAFLGAIKRWCIANNAALDLAGTDDDARVAELED